MHAPVKYDVFAIIRVCSPSFVRSTQNGPPDETCQGLRCGLQRYNADVDVM